MKKCSLIVNKSATSFLCMIWAGIFGLAQPMKNALPEPTVNTKKAEFALTGGAFEKFKSNFQIRMRSPNGYPQQFTCIERGTSNDPDIEKIWQRKLPLLLDVDHEERLLFHPVEKSADPMGNVHLKFDQFFGNLPILNHQYFVHISPGGSVIANGQLSVPTEELRPNIHENQLDAIVSQYFDQIPQEVYISEKETGFKGNITRKTLAYWQRPQDSKWHLVYQVKVLIQEIEPWTLWINAENGEVLKARQNICSFHAHSGSECHHNHIAQNLHASFPSNSCFFAGAETTTAIDLNGVSRTIQVWREGNFLYGIDASKLMFQSGSFDLNNPVGVIWTLDALGSSNPGINQVRTQNNMWAPAAVSAHYQAAQVYDYFLNTFNRNSIDGKGTTIRSYVNFATNYAGAFWANGAIYYGGGSVAKGYSNFAKGLDISAHEMSHGVIDATAGLEYDAESGAINESFADIFAAMTDRANWTLGEDVILPGNPARPTGVERNMANPSQNLPKDSFRLGWQPMHVNQQYKGLNDGGGVHWNSGIPNHAFYLFVQNLIAVAGSEEDAKKIAEQVYYHALKYYLTRQANFRELRSAIEQSCTDLHPADSRILMHASAAFEAVGITSGAENGGGVFDFNQKDLPVNPGTEFLVCTRSNTLNNRNEGVHLRNLNTQQISQLSNLNIICKPAVTDDGSAIYFVATDFKVYKLQYNATTGSYDQSVVIDNPVNRFVTVSKDGRFLALLESPTQNNNQVKVVDLVSSLSKVFTISNPVVQTGISNSIVTQISSLDFDHSGRYLVYDALSTYTIVNGTNFQQWDMGVLRFWNQVTDEFGDGAIEKIFRAPLADIGSDVIYHFRNPVFSKNSPYIIAFDFYIGNFNNQTYQNSYAIVGADLEKGELKYIQQGRQGFAFPNYSMEDDSLSFDDAFQMANRPGRIQTVGLQQNKVDSSGASIRFMNGYRWGNRFGNGNRDLILNNEEKNPEQILFKMTNPVNDFLRLEFENPKSGKLLCNLYDIFGRNAGSWVLQSTPGRNIFEMEMTQIKAGSYFFQMRSDSGIFSRVLIKN